MLYKKFIRKGLIALFTLFCVGVSTNLWAHGGVAIEIDTCRIPVGDQWVHFTGYTPMESADAEYCNTIPYVGHTNLVFDYESRVLTKMTVEFTITKEPEGTEVYHQDPKTIATGTVNVVLDFSKPELGEGDYLAHVTLVADPSVKDGKKIDAHLPFEVTSAGAGGLDGTMIGLIAICAVILGAYFFMSKKDEDEEAAA